MVIGILAGLWMLPPVRYTLGSQLRFALVQDSLPWLRSLDSQRSQREQVELDVTASLLPDDYLLQVGRATVSVTAGSPRPAPLASIALADNAPGPSDRALLQRTRVARDFPLAAGAQAHLARYMMISDRIRVQRAELAKGNTIPPRFTDVKLMTWALNNGKRIDPDNAFWTAMLATTYFAAGRDSLALDALAQSAQQTRWDSYLYEEVLGQWRLYSLAYGDHGAAQKIGPLSLLAFPHLQELRHMAEMARWYADQAAAQGDVSKAIRIRRSIRGLGHILRDNATWAFEALYGTDLLLISACDSDSASQASAIHTVRQWEKQAQRYLAFLKQAGRRSEITLLYTEVEESCRLRAQVDGARADASYPGIPPGIPLIALFGAWMTGVCLLQQSLLLCLGVGSAWVWQQWAKQGRSAPRMARLLAWWFLAGITTGIGLLLFTNLPSSRLAIFFFAGIGALLVMGADAIQQVGVRRADKSTTANLPPTEPLFSSSLDSAEWEPALLRGSSLPYAVEQGRVAERWGRGTTLRFLIALLVPCLLLLWQLHPLLSSLHPVALLLEALMGIDPPASGVHALQVGLLACALPLTLVVELCAWAMWRRVRVTAAVTYGLRRLFLPALTGCVVLYLLLLNQTLRLDNEASHAINEAAKDDLHWVLTHSENEE